MTKGFDHFESEYEFQDRILKFQIYQEFQASEVNINDRDLDQRKKTLKAKNFMGVVEYLKNSQIYDEMTDKIIELSPQYVQDDSWGFLYFKPKQQNYSLLRNRRNSMKLCQGQDGKSLIDIEEPSGESEDETIKTDSERNLNSLVRTCKNSEPKEDSCGKVKGERLLKLSNASKVNISDDKIEESKNSPDNKTQSALEDDSQDSSSSGEICTSSTNSAVFKTPKLPMLINQGISLDKLEASHKSDSNNSQISKELNSESKDSENATQLRDEYGPEEIRELVSEIRQKVIDQRKYGWPERFISLLLLSNIERGLCVMEGGDEQKYYFAAKMVVGQSEFTEILVHEA